MRFELMTFTLQVWRSNQLSYNGMLLDNRIRTDDLRNYSPPLYQLSSIEYLNLKRCRQGSNLRGQSPIDFKSISLTTRTRHQIKVPPGFEPRTTDSKSAVITKLHYRTIWIIYKWPCTQWGSNPRGLTPTRTWVWRLRPLGHACFN